MLFDTDVLIWVFRGHAEAAAAIEAAPVRFLSTVTYMELLQGTRDRREVRTIKAFLRDADIRMVPLSENIGHRAAIYMEEFGLKCGLDMADALIAATAVENRLSLCTADQRHYRILSDLEVTYFRP